MKNSICLAAIAVGAAALIAGCQTGVNNTSYGHITRNLTPELKGASQRQVDNRNARMYAENTNMRLLSDDLARTFLLDHPVRLSPFPIVDASGQPR